jgi:hypothetical protein
MQENPLIKKEYNMKSSSEIIENEDDIREEYDFSDSKPNKYAAILKRQARLVTLEPDVFKVFHTSEQVNNALRAFINAIPKSNKMKIKNI